MSVDPFIKALDCLLLPLFICLFICLLCFLLFVCVVISVSDCLGSSYHGISASRSTILPNPCASETHMPYFSCHQILGIDWNCIEQTAINNFWHAWHMTCPFLFVWPLVWLFVCLVGC
ncbi:hypothetical protein DL93DRAFT_999383 [Clavulina sp. PMI_390]|nr:hypothetical protein DL93DRAFT_999383 [Clavulina sp. PMI_390]